MGFTLQGDDLRGREMKEEGKEKLDLAQITNV